MELSNQQAEAVRANAGLTPEPAVVPEPPTAEELDKERNQSRLKKLGALLIPVVLLASKGKFLFLALIKVKAVTTLGTMFISIAAYALAFGWPFAVGFVLLLFVHEMGHVIQLRREGVEASAPIFIPFVGAVIAVESLGRDAAAEARVGLAGPILGTIGTLIPLVIWLATGSDLWRALAYVGFFINLINLLPVLPLDGGRAMAVLGPMVWIAGILLAVAATVIFLGPFMLLFVLLLGGPELYHRFKNRHSEESREFHSVPTRTKLAVAAVYLSLAVLPPDGSRIPRPSGLKGRGVVRPGSRCGRWVPGRRDRHLGVDPVGSGASCRPCYLRPPQRTQAPESSSEFNSSRRRMIRVHAAGSSEATTSQTRSRSTPK
jgi:Zn-dependent protease